MFVIMRNNWPLEIFNGTMEQADARTKALEAEYCAGAKVKPMVYFHFHDVPVVNGEEACTGPITEHLKG